MRLGALDLAVIAAYFAANLAVGLYLRRRATRSVDEFFLSGRFNYQHSTISRSCRSLAIELRPDGL